MLTYNGTEFLQQPVGRTALMGNLASTTSATPKEPVRHIWIITGPSGCGKSTIAAFLAQFFDLPYIEGDDYHPQANREKMANGIPLNDEDRWDWLNTLQEKASEEILSGSSGCVVTCSALKRSYRDIIRRAGEAADNVCVRFVYLRANEELLRKRVAERQGHFFKDNMVKGQFRDLEEPDESEQDVIPVDVSQSLSDVKLDALWRVNQVMKENARI